jgi:transcriptional regulator GlxA family with amidase domain
MTAHITIKTPEHPIGCGLLHNPRLNKGTAFTDGDRRPWCFEGLELKVANLSSEYDARTADSTHAGLAAMQPTVYRGGVSPRALQRVREFIEQHLEGNISIEALATVAGLSKYYFARAFKQSEGITPHDYVMQCRVRRAQELLAGTDLPISEIAVAVGFSDQSHCARRFREHIGLTPSRYRWLMR